ncbi:hypothetical protein BGZ60DRAFT_415168 [Tricladium varicosporioides]|nr:hypothetical protein BGZ60DRAFT_415168 [Hymenoscyphus varicosporioides]
MIRAMTLAISTSLALASINRVDRITKFKNLAVCWVSLLVPMRPNDPRSSKIFRLGLRHVVLIQSYMISRGRQRYGKRESNVLHSFDPSLRS